MIAMADHADVQRDHGYHALRVKAVVQETADSRTLVFDVPDDLRELFAYRPGQFCTVRVNIGGDDVLRCYSMSSAPDVDPDLAVTVKRVAGGLMSNWLHDRVAAGDSLELARPAGVFCPDDTDEPVVGFCGGSGVTPVFSIVKHLLASTRRRVTLLVANRDQDSVIFHADLDRLRDSYPDRFRLVHHLDAGNGFLTPDAVAALVEPGSAARVFICGPTPFMDLVEGALHDAGVDPARISVERFVAGGVPASPIESAEPSPSAADTGDDSTTTVTVVLKGKTHVLDYTPGDTLLDSARRGGLKPPFSCELGNCASCMALLGEGSARMRANNALSPAEVAEGWVLTCQAVPIGRTVKIEYETF